MEDQNKPRSGSNGGMATVLPQIDSTVLSWLAEEAHGRQGKTLTLVKDAKGKPALREREKDKDVLPDDEPLFEVITPADAPPQMVRPDEVILKVPRGDPERLDLLEGCDALFWSTSAVEKFLFPYYAAHRLLSEVEMNDLKQKSRQKNVVALLHIAPSKSYARTVEEQFLVVRAGRGKGGADIIGLVEFLAQL